MASPQENLTTDSVPEIKRHLVLASTVLAKTKERFRIVGRDLRKWLAATGAKTLSTEFSPARLLMKDASSSQQSFSDKQKATPLRAARGHRLPS